MYKYKSKLLIIFFLSCFTMSSVMVAQDNQDDDDYKWQKELVRKVVITDEQLIDKLVLNLFITESNIENIEVFDVDGNGPAEGDILKVNPQGTVYHLYMLSKTCRELLAQIPIPENLQEVGETILITEPTDSSSAQEKILYVIAKAINALYMPDKPLKLFFEQNEDGIYKFELLGYNPEVFKKDGDFAIGKASREHVQDLLKALYKEFYEEYTGWQPTVIHVIKTEKDTLIMPGDNSK